MGSTSRTALIFASLCGVAVILAAVLLISRAQAAAGTNATHGTEANVSDNSSGARRPSRDELKQKLSPQQFHVVCNEGTEPPFQNAYWDNHEPGIYVDVVSGEPLFSSTDKFDSGTGWPSFTRPLEKQNVVEKQDHKLFVPRTEVRSKGGDSHLGHVFDDGPGPTGLRYCINSASLRFIPVDKLEAEGYGQYLSLFGKSPSATTVAGSGGKPASAPAPAAQPAPSAAAKPNREVATLAGGCFWGMEEILRKVPGVISTRVGYTGGTTKNPVYEDLHSGTTGHAEAVEITFDPGVISYDELLDKWFFRMHDPTTKNRQGNDIGTQYRSAIFYASDAQKASAQAAIERAAKSGRWARPITTEVAPLGTFWDAEEYHQDYLQKHPGGYTCHWIRD